MTTILNARRVGEETLIDKDIEVHYLNTDLEIESVRDLSRVVEEFGEDVIVLHHRESRGYDKAFFEIASGADLGVDEVINYFCLLVESLPKAVRDIWNGCFREFSMWDMKAAQHTIVSDQRLGPQRFREWPALAQVSSLPFTPYLFLWRNL